ncbi:MAG TPA: Fis family transcriptional regulator [Nitrospinae bacterium]|nr:Fis family transcriptional regulator [Nitrospinota bacterium]HBA26855.1 Fis family transcriptional regulator [Nitrospinota bacterium]
MPKNILIIDDEATLRDRLAGVLKEDKWHVQTAGDGASALKEVSERDFDLIICDLMLPDSNGIEILKKVKEINPNTLFIMITAYPTVENAVEAMKIGAKDYVVKPFRFDEIILRVRNLLYHQDVVRENIQLKEEIRSKYDGGNIIGKSPIMQKVYQMIDKVANTDANVLITGESGTGKEIIARAIHDKSLRKEMRFLPINCGAIPSELIEGELFGFKKGTFTGAAHDRKGLFESADRSTVFLDEISTLPITLQPKLLRFIETKEVLPMGGREWVKVDVRIVAATNQSLDKEVEKGSFRLDLYYRLKVVEINLPSLRDRKEDIPELVSHFISKFNTELHKKVDSVDEKVMGIFLSYPWKGNIRELENVIERAAIMCEGNIITLSDLPSDFISDGEESITNLKDYVKIHEKGHIKKVLIMANNDKKKAAELLDLSIPSLYRKIEELGI